jgi:hypothetical protein
VNLAVASIVDAKVDLQHDLEMCNLAFGNVLACSAHLELIDVTQHPGRGADGLPNDIVRAGGRRADKLDLFVEVVRHGTLLVLSVYQRSASL